MVATNNIKYTINTGVKNLLTNTGENETIANVTYTHNSDGSVLVNSSSGSHANQFHNVHDEKIYLKAGTYVFSGCPSGGSGSSYEMRLLNNATGTFVECKGTPVEFTLASDDSIEHVLIRIDATYNPSNMTFYPMICAKSVYDQDSSFLVGALPNSDLTTLEAEDRAGLIECVDGGAKNLIDFSELRNNVSSSNNITATNAGNGVSVTTTQAWSYVSYKIALAKGSYYMSCKISDLVLASGTAATAIRITSNNDGTGTIYGATSIFANGVANFEITAPSDINCCVVLYLNASSTAKTQSYTMTDVMLCTKAAFSVSPKFVPYRMPYTTLGSLTYVDKRISLPTITFSKGGQGDYYWLETITGFSRMLSISIIDFIGIPNHAFVPFIDETNPTNFKYGLLVCAPASPETLSYDQGSITVRIVGFTN